MNQKSLGISAILVVLLLLVMIPAVAAASPQGTHRMQQDSPRNKVFRACEPLGYSPQKPESLRPAASKIELVPDAEEGFPWPLWR